MQDQQSAHTEVDLTLAELPRVGAHPGVFVDAVYGIRGMIRLRDALRRCLRTQVEAGAEDEIQTAREQLNHAYDRFVSRHGPISQRANTSAFRGDPDLPLLLSLEHYGRARGNRGARPTSS